VEADHGQPPAGGEQGFRRAKPACQFAELVIDVDAKRLKSAGRRVDAVMVAAGGAAHDPGQPAGARDRRLVAGRGDGAGDAPGVAFLAEPVDDPGELFGVGAIDQVRRAGAGPVHAHVERPVEAERRFDDWMGRFFKRSKSLPELESPQVSRSEFKQIFSEKGGGKQIEHVRSMDTRLVNVASGVIDRADLVRTEGQMNAMVDDLLDDLDEDEPLDI